MNETNVNVSKHLLKLTYGLLFILAGADKFFNFITNWQKYISKEVLDMLPFDIKTFIYIIGALEILLGIAILLPKWTKFASFIASAWLIIISLNLLAMKIYNDIAIRDAVMAIGAFVLSLLSSSHKYKD